MTLRCGKLPSQGHLDAHPVRLSALLPDALMVQPACDWSMPKGIGLSWQMLGNDTYGDCVPITPLNIIRTATAWTSSAVRFTDANALDLYARYGGFKADDPTTDRGMMLHDMLEAWKRDGILGHKLLDYAAVDIMNWDEVCTAIAVFGGLCCGFALPLSAKDQADQDFDFRLDTPATGSAVPGSWSGHATAAIGYKRQVSFGDIGPALLLVTWGGLKWISRAAWEAWADEAAAPIDADWVASGVAPSGLPLAELERRLATMGVP